MRRHLPAAAHASWLLLGLLTTCLPAGLAAAQAPSSNFDDESGSYLRARLLHEPHAEPWARPSLQLRSEDPWLAFDKAQHVTFGFLFTLGGQYVLVNKAGLSENEALPLSIGVAASTGLAKELLDRRRTDGFFSVRDLAADAIGIALATAVILL